MLENSEVLNNQAIELAARGEYSEAIACFKRAINIERENYLLWFNLGITYRDAGEMEKAKDAMNKALLMRPDDSEIVESMALLCYATGDNLQAFRYTAMGLDLNDSNYRLWNTLGVLYFNEDDYGSASEAFEQALCINPYYYDALFNLRDCYAEMGNSVGADECRKRMELLKR